MKRLFPYLALFLSGTVHAQERFTAAPRLEQMLINLMQLLLKMVGVAVIIAVLVGGITYLTSSGDEEAAERGKRAIIHAIIGLVVSLAGLIIIQTVFQLLE